MDAGATAIGLTGIAASGWVALSSIRTQRELARDAVRIDRENELRAVLDDAAVALQTAYQQLVIAVERVDRPPTYDDDDHLQDLHDQTLAEEGRYWVNLSALEGALEDLNGVQARLAVRLGSSVPLYGIVHNARNVLSSYGLRPLRELAGGAEWTDRPFGDSLREMTTTAMHAGRDAQGKFFEAAFQRVGIPESTQ